MANDPIEIDIMKEHIALNKRMKIMNEEFKKALAKIHFKKTLF